MGQDETYGSYVYQGVISFEFRALDMFTTQYMRIAEILNIEITEEIEDIDDEAFDVTEENLLKFLNYLKGHIIYPCRLISIKHFRWEEDYFFGSGRKSEYEELKKTRPTHLDTFHLIGFYGIDLETGVWVDVQRVSDHREFTLPLAELEIVDKESENYQLIDDYLLWFINNK